MLHFSTDLMTDSIKQHKSFSGEKRIWCVKEELKLKVMIKDYFQLLFLIERSKNHIKTLKVWSNRFENEKNFTPIDTSSTSSKIIK